ncbi:T9SS type A sorting domain-containing protein [Flavisolibacter sp. BT320]|nr:T9SS type A sorting domain-containing protein [Flavisolibacter longurius]
MRILFSLLLLLFLQGIVIAQSISVSGVCITGTSTLNRVADVDGKVAYEGTGTVSGSTGVSISIFWMGAPDNLWVLAFSGQPYFSSNCNRSIPPSTSNAACTWTVVDPSCTGGSPLSITGTGTLPIQLRSFTATKVGSQVQLAWSTASETNNKGFDVQRSQNGSDWVSIGFVNGAGQSTQNRNYQFEDFAPLQGKNYYRLVQVDFDNRSTASHIALVDISAARFYALQQAGNGQYRLQISSTRPVAMQVVDMNGKKLLAKTVAQGVHSIDLGAYAQGVYLLQLNRDNVVTTEKLVKQ